MRTRAGTDIGAALRAPSIDPPSAGEGTWLDTRLSERDYQRVAKFVEEQAGIRLGESKRVMVEARLRKRLRALDLSSFAAYCDVALAPGVDNEESIHLIDQLTTNKTDFFREPGHFDYLVQRAIPTMMREHGVGLDHPLRVWSAACSTGEEPYTLAMLLSEVAAQKPGFRFEIHASDLSTEVLAHALRGVYEEERIAPVPKHLRAKHLLQSKDRDKRLVRVASGTRDMVQFRRLNLIDGAYPFREPFDVIFCRNVFIYFDRTTQERILGRFHRHLRSEGYLFLGHSEAITSQGLPFKPVAPTTYRATRNTGGLQS